MDKNAPGVTCTLRNILQSVFFSPAVASVHDIDIWESAPRHCTVGLVFYDFIFLIFFSFSFVSFEQESD